MTAATLEHPWNKDVPGRHQRARIGRRSRNGLEPHLQ